MIKYLGSKRLLIPKIIDIAKSLNGKKVLDLFSGTSRVGKALQDEGYTVISNDISTYGYFLAKTYVEQSPEAMRDLAEKIEEVNTSLDNEEINIDNWFTKTYCEESMFFHPKNGIKIERARNFIEASYKGTKYYEPLIVSLIEAADRVDSTCGVQMAYLKKWAPRASNDLLLRVPDISLGEGLAVQKDAKEAAKHEVDIVYMDPPYNQHNYLGNYHIWETICLWDNPEVYGKAKKRVDVKTRKSNWNSKLKIFDEMKDVVENLQCKACIVSFNNEGYLSQEQIEEILQNKFSSVVVEEVPYERYVGAKIGIHNQKGEKVGKASHTKNKELIFIAQ